MVDIVTIGELTLDNIVLPNGTVRYEVLGGGALYSAVGALIWGHRVGINSITGSHYYQEVTEQIKDKGIDVTGISQTAGRGLELWNLHETEAEKQQVPTMTSGVIDDLDLKRQELPEEYQQAQGIHLAPQSPAGHSKALEMLNKLHSKPTISMDILADEYIKKADYIEMDIHSKVTAFLPSREEIFRVWGENDIQKWIREMVDLGCPLVSVKIGSAGSLIWDPTSKSIVSVPVYSSTVKDTTGAGDAYCGGFLAGLVEGKDAVTSAAMGTVSASYVIAAIGALETYIPSKEERQARLQQVLGT